MSVLPHFGPLQRPLTVGTPDPLYALSISGGSTGTGTISRFLDGIKNTPPTALSSIETVLFTIPYGEGEFFSGLCVVDDMVFVLKQTPGPPWVGVVYKWTPTDGLGAFTTISGGANLRAKNISCSRTHLYIFKFQDFEGPPFPSSSQWFDAIPIIDNPPSVASPINIPKGFTFWRRDWLDCANGRVYFGNEDWWYYDSYPDNPDEIQIWAPDLGRAFMEVMNMTTGALMFGTGLATRAIARGAAHANVSALLGSTGALHFWSNAFNYFGALAPDDDYNPSAGSQVSEADVVAIGRRYLYVRYASHGGGHFIKSYYYTVELVPQYPGDTVGVLTMFATLISHRSVTADDFILMATSRTWCNTPPPPPPT